MASAKERFEAAVDFILNQADNEELVVLQAALERRIGGKPQNPADLNFGKMAKATVSDLTKRFDMPGGEQIHDMTRRLVKNMIQEREPDILEEDLEVLLDQWVPNPNKVNEGKEAEIPLDALTMMVDQFIKYSMGELSKDEDASLREHMGEWPKKYWDVFSVGTRKLLADFLRGGFNIHEFWRQFQILHGGPGGR